MWKSGKAREEPANHCLADESWDESRPTLIKVWKSTNVNQCWSNCIWLHLPPRNASNCWSVTGSLKIGVEMGWSSGSIVLYANLSKLEGNKTDWDPCTSPFQVCFLCGFIVGASGSSVTESDPSVPAIIIPVCGGTQNGKRYRYLFWYQIFSIPIPVLFSSPNFSDTGSETFPVPNFYDTDSDTYRKNKQIPV